MIQIEKYIVKKTDGQTITIRACLFKDYLCSVKEIGIGEPEIKGGIFNGDGDTWEEYKEYRTILYPSIFLKSLLEKDGLLSEAQKAVKEQVPIDNLSEPLLKCIAKVGTNQDGTVIISEKEMKKNDRKQQNEFLKRLGFYWKKLIIPFTLIQLWQTLLTLKNTAGIFILNQNGYYLIKTEKNVMLMIYLIFFNITVPKRL